ncbi:HNH endonuclease [Alkaliphilus sp. B6464]|uniref:HNH endonuclease n=1 Tax=Alkaliphilus sp. B6464 TaxID=2731219 RepID=UPI001BA45E6D|nr:HNH endonuclease [Alkaliphilus sp. B6464]QUH21089.1 HNH endonuclease [Alkaliphilus sp. B6464]
MLKSCKYCMRIHDSKFDCGKKPKRKKEVNDINKFRWSRRWREKREQIAERDKYLCQLAIREEPPRYIHSDIEVHHIAPIAEDYDLRLEDSNLITLSEEYHEKAECGEITKEYLRSILKEQYGYDYPPGE